jgi:hypothetical protein
VIGGGAPGRGSGAAPGRGSDGAPGRESGVAPGRESGVAPDRERAAYLRETAGLLWPAPATVTAAAQARVPVAAGDLIVLPGLARPRLLVPVGRRAGAAAVRRYGEPGSARARLGSRGLALLLGSGLGRYLLRDRLAVRAPAGAATIETYLSSVLDRDLSVSLHIGAARANRKPVLQLLSPRGETLGFAKIGVNALTRQLVRAERDALREISAHAADARGTGPRGTGLDGRGPDGAGLGLVGPDGAGVGPAGPDGAGLDPVGPNAFCPDGVGPVGTRLGSLTVPRVLHHGTWQDLDVLVLGPLPVWQRRRPLGGPRLAAAMGEVALLGGLSRHALTASAYWQRLLLRAEAADASEDRADLLSALGRLGCRAGDLILAFGCWHGDWTPWNMACTSSGLLVWDWERFGSGVPLGFDALHYWLQRSVVAARGDPPGAAADCVQRAAALLRPLGVTAAAARLTALLYLADLSARYLGDRQADAGARLGAPGRWLIPALSDGADRL